MASKTLYWSVPSWEIVEKRTRVVGKGRGKSRRTRVEEVEIDIAPFSSVIHQQCLDHCRKYKIPRRLIKTHVG